MLIWLAFDYYDMVLHEVLIMVATCQIIYSIAIQYWKYYMILINIYETFYPGTIVCFNSVFYNTYIILTLGLTLLRNWTYLRGHPQLMV